MKSTRLYIAVLLTVLNLGALAAWWILQKLFTFAHPEAFWLLVLLPVLSIYYVLFQNDRHTGINYSVSVPIWKPRKSMASVWRHLFFVLRLSALFLLTMAMGRPQAKDEFETTHIEGIDIMLALDISESMLAQDLYPDRLRVARQRAIEFVDDRPDDRIGLVVFQGEAFTQVPLTTDHRVLKNAINEMSPGLLEPGTAVGMGLATALGRIKDAGGKTKIVILLTDGEDNRGQIRPLDAAAIAKTLGVRVYTIGVGKKGPVRMPVRKYPNGQYEYAVVENHIDEATLRQIASMTGGKYFEAASSEKLADAYREINDLERTRMEVTQYSKRHEEFYLFLLPALFLLFSEVFVKLSIPSVTA